jgi:hypothetical protein
MSFIVDVVVIPNGLFIIERTSFTLPVQQDSTRNNTFMIYSCNTSYTSEYMYYLYYRVLDMEERSGVNDFLPKALVLVLVQCTKCSIKYILLVPVVRRRYSRNESLYSVLFSLPYIKNGCFGQERNCTPTSSSTVGTSTKL